MPIHFCLVGTRPLLQCGAGPSSNSNPLAMKTFSITILMLWCAATITQQCHSKEISEEFKIVPNKGGRIEVALDTPPIESSTCKFEWDSSGATVEQWVMKVVGDPGSGEIGCEIQRRDGGTSYLMFTKFKTTLGTNPILEAIMHDNDGEMHEDNFNLEGECIENAHDWSGGTIRQIKLKSMAIS